ncbi:hypothetical protein ACFXKC_32370 [Streptomyces sp. NPDC059340]|uniref:hypothetical protein n=1 Tax=Streptomyces sp. NPDC059340 TaxID=3346806 RepID=UPI003694190C
MSAIKVEAPSPMSPLSRPRILLVLAAVLLLAAAGVVAGVLLTRTSEPPHPWKPPTGTR